MKIIEPYHDDEARGVLFEVMVQGRRAQGYISCALLQLLVVGAIESQDWVAAYRRRQRDIDAVVARRAPDEDWETVMVDRIDLLPGR